MPRGKRAAPQLEVARVAEVEVRETRMLDGSTERSPGVVTVLPDRPLASPLVEAVTEKMLDAETWGTDAPLPASCTNCGKRLMFSARERGDGLCGPCHRTAGALDALEATSPGPELTAPDGADRSAMTAEQVAAAFNAGELPELQAPGMRAEVHNGQLIMKPLEHGTIVVLDPSLVNVAVAEVPLDGSWDKRDNRCHIVDRRGHMIGEPLRDIVAAAQAFKVTTNAQRIIRTRDGMVMGHRLSAAKAGDPPKPRFSLKRRKKTQ